MKRQWILALVAVSALAADGANVKAFIPSLTPVNRVEAAYPDAARQQNSYGLVKLFVTVDAGGNVVTADAMVGPTILRQVAADAVKQWTYRPVIRDGHAVPAITTATVSVMPTRAPGEPPLKITPDIPDEMAFANRQTQLTKQFPRTPQQVLADDEQQALGESGIDRFYQLPELAKAAYRGGDFVKAKALATEMLGDAPQYPHDWSYGNAIHDGNMILGLVALKQGTASSAAQYLLAAGKTPGSPQLNSFGPNMELAHQLIAVGQTAAVLQYFDECRAFWKLGGARLDDWSATVRGGGTPNFGANLVY